MPNIVLSDPPNSKPIGKYGSMRRAYLKNHEKPIYELMSMQETLFPHLREVDEAAQKMLEQLMPRLTKAAGVTEELKAKDQMRWVGLMNNCRAQAEEIIKESLIYA